MVGAGVFQLPARFATQTGVYGALVAWTIAGAGMLALAFVFQNLAIRKPLLDNGVYVYARAGFGLYPGFLSAFGFWASACAGNAFYWVLIMTTMSQLFPEFAYVFGKGDTWPAFFVSVAAVWGFFFLIRRGVKEAAWINFIVTIAKLVPLALFLMLVIVFFDGEVFVGNLTGGYDLPGGDSLFRQVRGTMLVTVFVFLGIEGASVYSRYAKRREDVGTATVLGFLSVLALFASISILSFGILPKAEIAGLTQPSIGGVLEAAVGPWGGVFIRIGLIVSVLGAYLAWTLMAAEVLYIPARSDDMPRFLARTNRHGAPVNALVMAAALTSLLLVALLFASYALDFMLDLTAALSLIPYLLAAAYALKLTATRETYGDRKSLVPDMVIAGVATVYTLFLLYAAGMDKLLLSCILYAPAAALYVKARRERGLQVFRPAEAVLFGVIVIGAVAGVVSLATGALEI